MEAIDYNRFWTGGYYIKLKPDLKEPAEIWGGYSQDFSEADNVYTWEDLKSNVRYGVIGHTEFLLGVVDIDSYKDDAPDVDDITVDNRLGDRLIIRSPAGGVHIPYLVDAEYKKHSSVVTGIDVKGELAQGHVVLPEHNSDYEIVSDGPVPLYPSHDDSPQTVMYNDEPVFEVMHKRGDIDLDFTIPDVSDKHLHLCEFLLLLTRATPAREDYGSSPFEVDTHAGMCMLSNGRSIDDCVELMSLFPPAKVEGFNESETRYQLSMLKDKLEEGLIPPSKSIVENGIDVRLCGCNIHSRLATNE